MKTKRKKRKKPFVGEKLLPPEPDEKPIEDVWIDELDTIGTTEEGN